MLQYLALAIVGLINIFVTWDCVQGQARSCYFGPPPPPDPNNPDPNHWMKQVMEQVRKNCPGRRKAQAQPHVSCRAVIEAGDSTGLGYYDIKPPCDSSSGTIQVLCNQDAYGGGWMLLYRADTTRCLAPDEFTWTGERISCPKPENHITGLAVSYGALRSGDPFILDDGSCSSLTVVDADFIAAIATCITPSSSGWSWGNEGVLVEGVCSTAGSWRGTFDGCGSLTDVHVNVSISFGSSDYGTYIMSCYDDDSGSWAVVDEWVTISSMLENSWRNLWIKT